MADQNIAAIEAAFEPWSRGDFSSADPFHERIEFVTDYPERQVHTGLDDMGKAWGDFRSAWQDFTVTSEEIIPVDDGRYLVLVRLRGKGSESGLPIEQSGANLVAIEKGKITRFELYFERERGQAAARITS